MMGLKEFFYNLNGLFSAFIPNIPVFHSDGTNRLPLKDY
jgi:hypothetical protein